MMEFRWFTIYSLSFLILSDAAAQSFMQDEAKDSQTVTVLSQLAPPTKSGTTRDGNVAAINEILVKSTELIKNGRAAEAYSLLLPYQSDMAGNPDYDYLLGLASLDNGKPNEAIFALERCLAVKPNHLQARAEIARAYLVVGELAASKQEFETVKQQNPPKEVSVNIQKYLDIIEAARTDKKTNFRAYIEVMVGDDSNVNTATNNKQVAIPLFGGTLMNLNSAGTANRDTFGSISTGFSIRHALTPIWELVGGININKRNNSTQIAFDNGNGDANFGVSLNKGDDNYMAVVQAQTFILENVTYRNSTGMTAQWQKKLSSNAQLSSYLQYSSLTYPDQQYRDAKRYVLGSAYATSFSGELAPVIFSGIYVGYEQPLASNVAYLANSLYGIRLGGEIKLHPKYTLLASASLEKRVHKGVDTLFLLDRNDTQGDLKIGLNYMPAQNWTISPSVSYTNNESNIIINKYDRTVLSLSARRDFN